MLFLLSFFNFKKKIICIRFCTDLWIKIVITVPVNNNYMCHTPTLQFKETKGLNEASELLLIYFVLLCLCIVLLAIQEVITESLMSAIIYAFLTIVSWI